MRCINSPLHDPWFNIAAEEYVLKHLPGNSFILYRNEKSVIVGAHQNTLAEINLEYVQKHHIKIVRRLSGGGAVFHDLGNINFTFISDDEKGNVLGFQKFTKPILEILKQLGVEACFEGRNDLTIKGMKFSGNAEHVYKGRVLHHGTLLFDSIINDLSGALAPNPLKFQDKAVKSVRSRVTNIREHLSVPISVEEFQELIMQHMKQQNSDCYPYEYSETDLEAIHTLARDKYSTWAWNFGSSPKYNLTRGIRTGSGFVECKLLVEKGLITQAKIFGDFFGSRDPAHFEQALIGMPHERSALEVFLKNYDVSECFSNITAQELIDALI